MSTEVAIDPAKLDALFAPFDRTDGPGVAVGVAHRGVPVYRRGFGLANVELPVALGPSIRMRIGSTSKHFTCLCIMLLAEEGLLRPEDSVRKYLPELKDWADGVTLRGLMSHTSGTRCSLDLLSFMSPSVMGGATGFPADGQLKMLFGVDSVNFAPGDYYSYSNGGYVLLTEVIQRVGGLSYGAFLERRIFRPVGMHDTLARPLDTDCVPNSAALHFPRKDGGWTRGLFGPPISGEGNIASTVDDMLLWLRHMAAPVVGSAATWEAMSTPVRLNHGTSTGYGYGLFRETIRGVQTIHHAGAVIGGAAQMLKVLGHELDVVILSNGAGNPPELAKGVIGACITGLEPAEETSEVKEPVSGDFYSAVSGRYLKLSGKEGRQILEMGGGAAPVEQRADGSIVLPVTLYPEGRVRLAHDEVTWDEYGVVDRFLRLGERDPSGTVAILGSYHAPEFGLTATIEARNGSEEDGDALLRIEGLYGRIAYRLTGWTDALWLAASVGAASPAAGLCVQRDGTDLLVTTGRNNRIRLRRL